MRSWRSVISLLLIITFFCMLVFMVWANIDYYMRIEETYQKENEQAAKVWSNIVATRLGNVDEHIHELMLLIYDKTELQAGTPMMQYMAKRECLELMQDKLLISDDTTCMFILDTDSDTMLFSATSEIHNYETSAMKSYLREQGLTPTRINDNTWEIVEIGEKVYFAHAVSLGKFVVGVLCSIKNFDITTMMNVLGDEMSCLLVYDNQVFHVSGSDWSEDVLITGTGEALISDRRLSMVASDMTVINATVLIASKSETMVSSLPLFVATSCTCLALLLIILVVMQRMVSKPTEEMLLAIRAVKNGDLQYRITSTAQSAEFDVLYNNFNDLVSQIHDLRIEAYDRTIQQQRDELTMLRAQIKPHFYLNAITTVSNMTYQGRMEDIRNYLASLAKYMRYMLNLQEKYVTVGAEMEHVRNYLEMQKIKFPGSVEAYAGYSSVVANVKIPYLLLFTVVENTFKHAMSLYSTLSLMIHCEWLETDDFAGCRIVVQDNGCGFPEDVLDVFRPGSKIPKAKDHFGLSNVSRTLQLIYGRDDLLHIENVSSGGAHVEIWIPEQYEEELLINTEKE